MPSTTSADAVLAVPRPRAIVAWATLACATATALIALRVTALLVMFHVYRAEPVEATITRIAATFGFAVPFAMAVGAVTAAIALSAAMRSVAERSTRAAPARFARLALTIATISVLFLAVLSGWPLDIAEHIPVPSDPRGRAGLLRLAAAAVVGAASLTWLAHGVYRGRALARLFERRGALLLAAALLVLVPGGFWARAVSLRATRIVRENVRELLYEDGAFSIEERHSEREPYVDVLTPTRNYLVDGGDLPALIMPPPARVQFRVRPEDGQVTLRASAGLRFRQYDFSEECAVGFRIDVNGAPVFNDVIRIVKADGEAQRAWRHVGGAAGVPLRPGDVVTLSTTLVTPQISRATIPVITAGFGKLFLDRKVARTRQRASSAAPNIVLIVMDTLRTDRLSCYGQPLATTPALDRLAARGILYEQAYATASWTWPSTASILTGISPAAHGVVDDFACHLSSGLETLAEALASRGYVTGAFSCNPLIGPNTHFDQGFETMDASAFAFRKSDVMLPGIVSWLRDQAPYRFFLYLHLVDPHMPHAATPQARALVGGEEPAGFTEQLAASYVSKLEAGEGHTPEGESRPERVIPPEHQRWLEQSYTASVATCDEYVGRVLDELTALGLDENTLIAFTSDHGEEFLDHGLLAHGQSVYEELVHVPLILAGAGISQRGARSDAIVSNRHLAPTLARAGGASLAQAEDPLDLIRPFPPTSEPVFFSTLHGWWNGRRERLQIDGIRDGPWVLHYAPAGRPWGAAWTSDPGQGEVRLYDLSTDPKQLRDRSKDQPEVARELRARVIEHVRSASERKPARVLGAGSATMDMLRNVGYVGGDAGDPDAHEPLPKKPESEPR
jgi:arylsulfatase A-like enzyme